MIKELIRHSALYTFLNLITRGLSFILLPIYARFLSPSDFGVYDYLVIMGGVLAVIIPLEISQGLARHIPDCDKNSLERKLFSSSALWFTMAMYLGFFVLLLFNLSFFSVKFLGSTSYKGLLLVAFISFWINGLLYQVRNMFKWEIRPDLVGKSSIVQSVLQVLFSVILIVVFKWGIWGVFYAQILSGVITFSSSLFWGRHNLGWIFSFEKIAVMLSYSFPLVFSGLGVILSQYIDRIAIRSLLSFSDLGVYGVAFRVSMIASLATVGIQNALTPLILNNYKKKTTPAEISKIFNLFCAISFLLILTLTLYGKQVILVFAGMAYIDGYVVIPFLVSSILFGQIYLFFPGLNLKKKTMYIATISISVALVNLCLNYLLMPSFGILGAAVATTMASFFGGVLYWCFGHRYYKIQFCWRRVLVFLFMVYGLIYVCSLFGDNLIKLTLINPIILLGVGGMLYKYNFFTRQVFWWKND